MRTLITKILYQKIKYIKLTIYKIQTVLLTGEIDRLNQLIKERVYTNEELK